MELLKEKEHNFHHKTSITDLFNCNYSLGTKFVQVCHFFTLSKADTKAASSLNVCIVQRISYEYLVIHLYTVVDPTNGY